MSAEHRVIAKLEPDPDTVKGWLDKGESVTSTGNANPTTFSAIAALLAQATADTSTLATAYAKAANKGRIEMTARNAAWRTQQKSLRAFVAGVQGLMDVAPDAAHAQAIAAAASLETKLVPVRVEADPKVKFLGNGAARIYGRRPVPRRAGAYYEWAMSTDGGKTWVSIPGTNIAKAEVQGLTSASSINFRYRTTLNNVVSEWKVTQVLTVP